MKAVRKMKFMYLFNKIFYERKYLVARLWSNRELRRFAPIFHGKILNASGWKDIDYNGDHYINYFLNADEYIISNYDAEIKGLQGYDNEFYLDLVMPLNEKYYQKFDVVFNHTTLEHIFDFESAFKNLCALSKDIVILVVPFLEQMHGTYGDFWRFSPLAIDQLFKSTGFETIYLSFNNTRHTSVYIFTIASRIPEKWKGKIGNRFSCKCKGDLFDSHEHMIGCRAITNSIFLRILHKIFLKLFRYEKLKKLTEQDLW